MRVESYKTALLMGLARAVNGVVVRTYFDPDEYWQGLEVAHWLAFGNGHLTWEWQENVRIRGWAHPAVFAALYKMLAVCGVDSREMVIYVPRIFAGFAAGIAEWAMVLVAKRCCGDRAAFWALVANVFCWFYFYAAVRTYSNSMECVLTTIGLVFWPIGRSMTREQDGKRWIGLCFAAAAVLMRPTAAVFWVYAGLRHLVDLDSMNAKAKMLFLEVFPIGLVCSLSMVLIDYIGYGTITFVPLNFVRVNLLEGVGEEYGVHRLMWYFVECIPAILTTWLPFFVIGIHRAVKQNSSSKVLVEYIGWSLAIMSLSRHKELRFALPILPLANILVGVGISHIEKYATQHKKDDDDRAQKPEKYSKYLHWYLAFSCLCNVCVAFYLSLYHQRAPLAVMDFLASTEQNATFVDFYTRCHATPYTSHVHNTTVHRLRFLDCSPKLEALRLIPSMSSSLVNGVEEEDIFFSDQEGFLFERFSNASIDIEQPSHMVFDSGKTTLNQIEWVEKSFSMRKCASFFQTPKEQYIVLCKVA